MTLDNRCRYTLKRRAPDTWTEGVPTAGAYADPVPFRGSQVQPLPGAAARALPEGERASNYGVLFTKTTLKPVDQDTGERGDEVVDLQTGITYKVMEAATYFQRGPVSHTRAVLRKMQERPEPAPEPDP